MLLPELRAQSRQKASFDRLCPIQAGQQENDGTDNDNVNKAGSEDPTQSKKDQSPSSLSDQKETVEQDAVINEVQ